jgi:type II secretory pathway component GspD/PulD (secretin)
MNILLNILISALIPLFIVFNHSSAQAEPSSDDRVIIQIVELEHADAEHLATVLRPFLSPQGRILAYEPTNSLIIRDKASIVDRLVEIIKGPPDS